MKPPEDVDGLLDQIAAYQQEVRFQLAVMPPSPVKDLMGKLLETAEPLVGRLRTAYPAATDAFRKQRDEIDVTMNQARQKVAQAKTNMDNLPPVEEIRKNLVPLVPPLPAGLSAQYADEMRSRYLPPETDRELDDSPGTAWQDWSLS